MTAQNLIELVLAQSPLDDASIAKLHLANALEMFCEETLILRRRDMITLSSGTLRETITSPDDIIRIREIFNDEEVALVNTNATSYLTKGNGFWYVETNSPLQLYIGKWNGNSESAFEAGTTLNMIYSAYAQPFATDQQGNEDFSVEPEIPSRFHEALVYRANEKANFANRDMRSYWHALWRDELKKGRRHANEMHTNAPWNPKIYTL